MALALVLAHVGDATRGFADGLLHPLLGPDHLLAMIAVGVVAAITGTRFGGPFARFGVWAAPTAFVAGMALGGALGLAGSAFPGVEIATVVSVIALGLAVAGAGAVGNAAVWVPLLVLAGLAHGNAHGSEAPGAANPALYVAGFLVATVALHAAGVGTGLLLRDRPAARLAIGTSLAAAGVLLLV